MSQAEELLNSLSDVEAAMTYTSTPEYEDHIVIDDDRHITVPDDLKRLAVQFDHNIETVTFDCPRYWDGLDMSEMKVYINYLRADGEAGCFPAYNVAVDKYNPNVMHFDWTIARNVTEKFGKIVFLVCIRKIDEEGLEKNHWNSELCKDCYISEGLEYDGREVINLMPDLITGWYNQITEAIERVDDVTNDLISARDSGEFNGATFTPNVSDSCDLSWTNDKGLANPKTVSIKGATFTPHVEINGDLYWTNDKGLANPEMVNIMGATFTPSVSTDGYISWTNNKGLQNPRTVNLKPNDGISPIIKITNLAGGYRLTIIDVNGTQYVDIMDTIIDASDAVVALLDNFVYIGEIEPTSGPILWFDTSSTTDSAESTVEVVTLNLDDDSDEADVVANVDGVDYAVTNLSSPTETDDPDTYELEAT